MTKKSGHISGPSVGAGGVSAANVPGVPAFVENGDGTIGISIGANGNSAVVEYAIYENTLTKYVGADGIPDEVAEVWQTLADWGSTITISGLTVLTAYTFKAKARNEADTETAFSADSETMSTLPDLDAGITSDNSEREVTGGNTRITGTPTWTGDLSEADTANVYYGDILFTYLLQNEDEDTSSISVEFSEDYDPDTETGTWAAATEGSGGDGSTGLTTDATGVSHVYSFDSYASCGPSESKDEVYIRITAIDAAAAEYTPEVVGPFGVNNRPAKMTWAFVDGRTWSKETQPVFIATLPSLRSGVIGFPRLDYYREEDGAGLTVTKASYQVVDGWEYETATDTWVSMTVAGIASAACDGTNRVKYTPTTALATGNYIITGVMYENRDRG